jgi:hypothetical protein
MIEYTDLVVETNDPDLLDQTLQGLPGVTVVVDDSYNGVTCVVRIIGDPGFVKFAIDRQGYGRVVGTREEPE